MSRNTWTFRWLQLERATEAAADSCQERVADSRERVKAFLFDYAYRSLQPGATDYASQQLVSPENLPRLSSLEMELWGKGKAQVGKNKMFSHKYSSKLTSALNTMTESTCLCTTSYALSDTDEYRCQVRCQIRWVNVRCQMPTSAGALSAC